MWSVFSVALLISRICTVTPADCQEVVIASVEGNLDNFTGTIKYLPEVELWLIIKPILTNKNISRTTENQLLPMLIMMNTWNF